MEAIGQLSGGIAHDFNNLLMAVLGSLELARKLPPGDPKIARLLDNAIQGAQRGATLTQRMLAFARQQDLNPIAIDVPALVRGMTDLLHSSLGPSISIETRFPLGLREVLADPHQLELALLNLVVNARDAMPKGGTIIISAREAEAAPELKSGRYISLSVSDTGEGMDDATLARAQEPFFTTKGIGKGTGLGLSMVHGMMEQSGGRLTLKSRKGDGTIAEILLPMARTSDKICTPDAPSLGHGTPRTRTLVVVAVDDDPLVLFNTASMLEDLGHKVFEATSASQALEILRRENGIDLLITDQAMPKMTGLELVEAIRMERPRLRAIVATGYAELPYGAKVDVFRLSKPFRQRDLKEVIAKAMSE
jgi:CheY-like chemotaxis protein